jgi:hypothetical protein
MALKLMSKRERREIVKERKGESFWLMLVIQSRSLFPYRFALFFLNRTCGGGGRGRNGIKWGKEERWKRETDSILYYNESTDCCCCCRWNWIRRRRLWFFILHVNGYIATWLEFIDDVVRKRGWRCARSRRRWLYLAIYTEGIICSTTTTDWWLILLLWRWLR